MPAKRLLVLATGGTIAGRAGGPTRHDYRPGEIGIADFLEKVAELAIEAEITGRQIANIGSEDMSHSVWADLHAALAQAMDDPECDAIIVTHGTDTVEETAFLLDLTLPTHKPVILVGAMRPADAVGYDGLRNFANAMRVALDDQAAGRGVLVVMGDKVFAARDIRKARTRGSEAFAGFPRDSVGLVTPSALEWFGAPWRVDERARLGFPQSWPDVPIIYLYAAIAPSALARQVSDLTKGLVIAGLGEGNMPEPIRAALEELAESGVLIVRASRVDEGLVDPAPRDKPSGFIAARALGPAKARILLSLLIAAGMDDPAAIQREFDHR